jgi:O-glycosyl hydrolase
MIHAGPKVEVTLFPEKTFQSIDGFGVNINARYWIGDRLTPALDLLVDDLGARLFRVDIWGKSNWIDPEGEIGKKSLERKRMEAIYRGEVFRRGWDLMRELNRRRIQPYLTASGDVPAWMLGPDGKTLADHDAFCEMLVSMVAWAKREERLDFTLFGPMNETDIGSPEGPSVSPAGYVHLCELLDEKLSASGLDDIRLVVPEQAMFNTLYLDQLTNSQKLVDRIAVFSMHDYLNYSPQEYHDVTEVIQKSLYAGKRMWFGEFGDLDQSGEKEWYVGWWMASRLLDQLEAGFHGALAWDAFDNYHDHDEAWTIYGLLRAGRQLYTPKKRYYALKQVYRFVLPGMLRIAITTDNSDIRALAFMDQDSHELVVVGMNRSPAQAYYLNIDSPLLPEQMKRRRTVYYRTSSEENCCRIADIPMTSPNYPFTGIEVYVPPESIFTLTTMG